MNKYAKQYLIRTMLSRTITEYDREKKIVRKGWLYLKHDTAWTATHSKGRARDNPRQSYVKISKLLQITVSTRTEAVFALNKKHLKKMD